MSNLNKIVKGAREMISRHSYRLTDRQTFSFGALAIIRREDQFNETYLSVGLSKNVCSSSRDFRD